jgi:hypothetical protein
MAVIESSVRNLSVPQGLVGTYAGVGARSFLATLTPHDHRIGLSVCVTDPQLSRLSPHRNDVLGTVRLAELPKPFDRLRSCLLHA